MGSALGERPSPSRCYPRPVNGTSTAPNGTVGMPPRANRHRIDPPAAAAKRSTLRPLVIYIYARKRFLQSLALGPPPVPQSPDRRCLVRRSGTESSQTRRWRKPDSNHRYHVARSRFPERLISSLLDFLPTEKLARTRTDTTTMPRALRGTDRRYGADGEDGNFVVDVIDGVPRCPSQTT